MRLIAIAILILAGAILSVGGTLAESLPSVRRANALDEIGLLVVAGGAVLFIAELLQWPPAIVRQLGRPDRE
jgi:hypothetical protein